MMNCQEALEKLHTYLDRELTEVEQHEVETHIATCPDCSDMFRFESGMLRLVGHHCRATQAPVALHQRVRIMVHTVTGRKIAP